MFLILFAAPHLTLKTALQQPREEPKTRRNIWWPDVWPPHWWTNLFNFTRTSGKLLCYAPPCCPLHVAEAGCWPRCPKIAALHSANTSVWLLAEALMTKAGLRQLLMDVEEKRKKKKKLVKFRPVRKVDRGTRSSKDDAISGSNLIGRPCFIVSAFLFGEHIHGE